jgi:hypothetical protein
MEPAKEAAAQRAPGRCESPTDVDRSVTRVCHGRHDHFFSEQNGRLLQVGSVFSFLLAFPSLFKFFLFLATYDISLDWNAFLSGSSFVFCKLLFGHQGFQCVGNGWSSLLESAHAIVLLRLFGFPLLVDILFQHSILCDAFCWIFPFRLGVGL